LPRLVFALSLVIEAVELIARIIGIVIWVMMAPALPPTSGPCCAIIIIITSIVVGGRGGGSRRAFVGRLADGAWFVVNAAYFTAQ